MSILPNKESVVKLASVAASGAGTVLAVLTKKGKALGNVGSVVSLAGSLLDDVPDQWVKQRAHNTYSQYRWLVGNTYYTSHAAANPAMVRNDCSAALQCFHDKSYAFEIGRVEHLTSTVKAICSAVAFGLSANNWAVGAVGGAAILVGPFIGFLVADRLPAPQPIAAVQTDVLQPPLAPNFTTMGDYKGAIAVMKFSGALGAAIGCGIGLGISSAYLSHKAFSDYFSNHFLIAITNAVAAGAVTGSALATARARVANTVVEHRDRLVLAYKSQIPANAPNPHAPIPGINQVNRAVELVFMGARTR